MNETVVTICATLVPILKINDEASDVAIRAVTISAAEVWFGPVFS